MTKTLAIAGALALIGPWAPLTPGPCVLPVSFWACVAIPNTPPPEGPPSPVPPAPASPSPDAPAAPDAP